MRNDPGAQSSRHHGSAALVNRAWSWHALAALALSTCIASGGTAQQAPRAGERIPTASPATGGMLSISLTPSRSQLTAGGTVGILGQLTNTSKDSTLYLSQASVSLTQAPELEGPMVGIRGWMAYFPGEQQGEYQRDSVPRDSAAKYSFQRYHDDSIIIAIKPGESVEVGWTPVRNSATADEAVTLRTLLRQTTEQVMNELRFLFFAPGDYQVAVQAKYWTTRGRAPFAYHTANQSIVVHVAAPQFVILLGAALGGLIAYVIFP
jgi:hypothetical protein